MHYTIRQGMQSTWLDRISSAIKQLTPRNWLPIGVACLAAFWIGLLFTALEQHGPANPGAASDLSAGKANTPMTVTSASDNSGELSTPSSSSNTTEVAKHQVAQPTVATGTSSTAGSSADLSSGSTPISPQPVIGGRGGDASPAPTAPAQDTTGGVTAGVGLTVGTPLTSEPITVNAGVGTDPGLQVNLGGL